MLSLNSPDVTNILLVVVILLIAYKIYKIHSQQKAVEEMFSFIDDAKSKLNDAINMLKDKFNNIILPLLDYVFKYIIAQVTQIVPVPVLCSLKTKGKEELAKMLKTNLTGFLAKSKTALDKLKAIRDKINEKLAKILAYLAAKADKLPLGLGGVAMNEVNKYYNQLFTVINKNISLYEMQEVNGQLVATKNIRPEIVDGLVNKLDEFVQRNLDCQAGTKAIAQVPPEPELPAADEVEFDFNF